ncbi:MAG: hypothetical protein GX776_09335 [Oxalobacter sp.]|nr:hypothetical protein [Oxalobacter sp.]
MIDRLKSIAVSLLSGLVFGLLLGAGGMFLLLSGCEAKKENKTLKVQAKDKDERTGITADIVTGNEADRRKTQETMGAIHAQTENYITADDNFILPAGAVRMYDDFVLRRVPGAAGIADGGTTGTEAHP